MPEELSVKGRLLELGCNDFVAANFVRLGTLASVCLRERERETLRSNFNCVFGCLLQMALYGLLSCTYSVFRMGEVGGQVVILKETPRGHRGFVNVESPQETDEADYPREFWTQMQEALQRVAVAAPSESAPVNISFAGSR